MRENTRSPQKKLLAAGVAVALGAGMVGVGANWDYVTSVIGNQFTATVADPDDVTERDNALLEVRGEAIDKTFDVTVNNDQVVADWTIANIGGFDAQFAANFVPGASIDQTLAENLEVFYTVDGVERRAGTVAAPSELTAVTGLSDILAVGESVDVQVRVVLPNPGDLLNDGTEIDEILNVVADWDVQYITVGGEA
jgi:hypothetical protein